MIILKQVCKSYSSKHVSNVNALNQINLTISAGEIFGIVGQSGAGKSTLIRCINQLEKPTSGEVIVNGQDLMQLTPQQLRLARRHIGMIFQHFNLFESRTVYQNIAFPLELSHTSTADIKQRVQSLLALTDLTDRQDHYPHALSGGQKQRVAIARALANHPSILLSDEATSALDPDTKHTILQLLKRINTEMGITIVLITHEMSVVKEICHRLAVLDKGEILEVSAVLDFFGRPQTTLAKKFARSLVMHDLPEILRARLSSTLCLWRLSFVGKAAETPIISHLARTVGLDVNILQAQIEPIRDEMVGALLVEVSGDIETIAKGKFYLQSQGVHIEDIAANKMDDIL